MKNTVKFFLLFLIAGAVASCKKNISEVMYQGGTAPVLTASSTASMVLDITNKNANAIALSWTNPSYKFTTGASSQDVTYTLQFDTTGSNFTNPKIQEMSIAKDLSTMLTIGGLNAVLLNMGLVENMAHNIEIRVKSTLANNSIPLYSNVIKLVITPYLDTKYPVPANLYITGSATPASWQCGCGEAELLSQKFTKISSTQFKITVALSANNSYLLLPVYGSWSVKYGGAGSANNSNNVSGDDFAPNGSDLKAPPTSGTYTITVDFKTGKFTVQ